MGDAFRPPSLAPFAVVTEPAPLRERERVLGRQNFGHRAGPCLLSHQLQLRERQDFANQRTRPAAKGGWSEGDLVAPTSSWVRVVMPETNKPPHEAYFSQLPKTEQHQHTVTQAKVMFLLGDMAHQGG